LGRILPDHRIAIDEPSVQALAAPTRDEWLTPLLMVISVGILGFVALFLQFRASHQQRMLLNRQRQFTTRVTHELKTPIAGIRLMAENLLSGTYREAEDIRHCARSIVQESERLQARIEEVLQLAQERTVPSPQPFDPEESLYAALDQWAPRMEAEGVRLEADIALTPMVRGDTLAIRDAVSALLDNALKYRDSKKPVPRVWMSMRHDGHWVSIRVEDNGIGVPDDMQEAIFEAFVRVEGPHRGLAGGHGLGLHQVAQIVQHHRGQVTCKSSVHGGALFEVLLPAMDVTAEEGSLG
jgi:signal transduction histidine kinase